MTSHLLHPSEFDTDSVASSPRSDHFHEAPQRVRFMCSFGGKILPRPHDNQLRYVGGDTRIFAVNRSISFHALLLKLFKLSGMSSITAKYQLPNEDLDALISVATDEDVENMMDEYDRIAHNQNSRSARLRLFLFSESGGDDSRAGSIGSLLNGSANRESWFLDALNGGVSALERGRSEASSMVSEVPDYLFGLDNSELETRSHQRETRTKDRSDLYSDPGSPAPVVSSSFCSTSSAPCVPSIPDVESKEIQVEAETGGQQQPNPYPCNPVVHYTTDATYSGHTVQPVPVYYFSGAVQPGNVPVHVQAPFPYVQQPYHAVMQGQVPVGYHHMVPGSGQVYSAGLRHVSPVHPYSPSGAAAMVHDGVKQQLYQAVPSSGQGQVYSAMAMTGGDELTGRGTNSLNE